MHHKKWHNIGKFNFLPTDKKNYEKIDFVCKDADTRPKIALSRRVILVLMFEEKYFPLI
jgi:hypothetical protein